MVYAIKHKRKNKFVSYIRKDLVETNPDRIKLDNSKPEIFREKVDALFFATKNHIPKNAYEVVKVSVREEKSSEFY